MIRFYLIVLVMAGGLLAASGLQAQAPAAAPGRPADAAQKPPAAPSSANPFPEDTSTVPVMPSKITPEQPAIAHDGAASAPLPLPGDEADPVRSPDDAAPETASAPDEDSSSSQAGLESLLPKPEDDQQGKKKKPTAKEPTHQEAASKDIEIGGYYLDRKNWKAALSRFESALVLDPENPDVYWGLAEANRHLGNLADAKANYEKVAEYDPDSHHGKEAIKALKEPAIANGKNAASIQPSTDVTK
jgi:tetratricopeptide (TPR) repeat protein